MKISGETRRLGTGLLHVGSTSGLQFVMVPKKNCVTLTHKIVIDYLQTTPQI